MRQFAPDPHKLFGLVENLKYKEGWTFSLHDIDRGQGSEGLTLTIAVKCVDSYHPENGPYFNVLHYMIVPAAAYDERAWRRWLLEQILLVETHEACEFFMIGDSRPYAPNHGPGRDPYAILEQGSYEDAHTTFRGERFEEQKM